MTDSALEATPDVAELEEALGYRFNDRELLHRALRHSSYAHEFEDVESNERQEFLGDAVLGLVVASQLFDAHPDWSEGDLTRALHTLVDRRSLAALAREIGVAEHLRLGRTEQRSGGRSKDSILADSVEAVLGAMYLDAGLEPVVAWARRVFASLLDPAAAPPDRDPKTRLQEWVMASLGVLPSYALVADSGVEGDAERFSVEVLVQGEGWGRGIGRSKRTAERAAALDALERREPEGD